MSQNVSTVLIIEDEEDIRALLGSALRAAGYATLTSGTGRGGVDLVRTSHVALALVDLMLPDVAGETVVRTLKSNALTEHIPIIILSARADEPARVSSLELGAEDYVTKPFSVKELLLRVRIALRRHGKVDCSAARLLQIDAPTHRVLVGGVEVSLTPIEFRLLSLLSAHPDHVHSRQTLLAEVWGMHPDLETRTVDTHIKRLREKLGIAATLIETVRGVGYRLREDGNPSSRGAVG